MRDTDREDADVWSYIEFLFRPYIGHVKVQRTIELVLLIMLLYLRVKVAMPHVSTPSW